MEMASMTTMKGGESSGLKLGFWKTRFHRWMLCGGGGRAEEACEVVRFFFQI